MSAQVSIKKTKAAPSATLIVTRALARAGLPPTPHVDLPAGSRPQVVNDEGYEVDQEAEEDALVTEEPDAEAEAGEEQAMEVDEVEPEAQILETVVEGQVGLEGKEPLLGLAESMVLPFSLTQTRQRHLAHLFPHVFSHPPISSHNKPRARAHPRGTLLYPTPAPPVQPLPVREYHGPLQPKNQALNIDPAKSGISIDGTTAKGKGKKKAEDTDLEPPAHEIDCVARVSLSIGPISFPGTELWVGRFVEPRSEPLSKSEKRERREYKQSPSDAGQVKRPKPAQPASGSSQPRSTTGPSKSTQPLPSAPRVAPYAVRPPSGGVRPPPAPGTRPAIEPELIQRVNQAATQHPWLSVIIHKAARNNATKEELAKLGRVVARLGRGEGVGEGPLDGITIPAAGTTPASSTTPASASTSSQAEPSTSAASVSPSNAASVAPSTSSTPQIEPQPKGPKQVGGGSIDPELRPDIQKPLIPLSASQSPTVRPVAAVTPTVTSATSTTAASTAASTGNATSQSARPPNAVPPVYTPLFANSSARPGPSKSVTTPVQGNPVRPMQPPPPRRIYPLPPPFLLVAFKEIPTEKYLLPLGLHAFVSRVGGDHVTHPTPKPPIPEATHLAATIGTASSGSSQPLATASHSIPAGAVSQQVPTQPIATPTDSGSVARSANKRTRASLGRGAKEQMVEPPSAVEEKPKVEAPPPITSKASISLTSTLPPTPGMQPVKGTVLMSTMVPVGTWQRPDWPSLGSRLPFDNTEFDQKAAQAPAPSTSQPGPSISSSNVPVADLNGPSTEAAAPKSSPEQSAKPEKRYVLNLGAEDFLPPGSAVQAVTIRIEGLDDYAWRRMRSVMFQIDAAEQRNLADLQPELLEPPPATISGTDPALTRKPIFDPANHPRLRDAYSSRRKAYFQDMLGRVPNRSFPRYRLPSVRSDLADVGVERWALRPYPISTKPLYHASPPPEGEDYEQMEELAVPAKKKRNQVEEKVTFEMPVSLDQLDERVEAGAKRSVKARGSGGRGRTKKPEDPNKKRYGARALPGRICEGCAQKGLRVWRRGPGGSGTLCKDCGDKFQEGTLGELKAPGAAKLESEGTSTPAPVDTEETSIETGSKDVVPEEPVDSIMDVDPKEQDEATLKAATPSAVAATSEQSTKSAENLAGKSPGPTVQASGTGTEGDNSGPSVQDLPRGEP